MFKDALRRCKLVGLTLYIAMPDALSRTAPIWCAVMNRVLFPEETKDHRLQTPPTCVSQSEHSQIKGRINAFVQEFHGLELDLSLIKSKLNKPLRPIWITRNSLLPSEIPQFSDCYPIILCTASRNFIGAEHSAAGYTQGAGDDSESWAYGLTPPIFWQHKTTLLDTTEDDLPTIITHLIQQNHSENEHEKGEFVLIGPTSQLCIGPTKGLSNLELREDDLVISCSPQADQTLKVLLKSRYLHLKCRPHKLGSRDLRPQIIQIPAFIAQHETIGTIYVSCETGADLSVGVALALLCLYFESDGICLVRRTTADGAPCPHAASKISKTFIRQRLSWIMTTMPYASPSRTTLQSVNDFLFTSSS
jgi:tRNA A64-2'-O-ribosylphosphate transferase